MYSIPENYEPERDPERPRILPTGTAEEFTARKAYEMSKGDGTRAYHRGEPLTACPFEVGTTAATAWCEGWNAAAQAEGKGDRE